MLLVPVLLPIIGGIFVFRQKTEKTRNRMVLWLSGVTAVCAVILCVLPEQSMDLLTIEGSLRLGLRSDALSKFFMALISLIWVPVSVFSFPYIRHAEHEQQFEGFYTMTLGILMGLALAKNFVTMYMFFEMMSLITMPLVLHNATPTARRAGFKYLGYSVFGAGMALAGFFFVWPHLAVSNFLAGGALLSSAAEHRDELLFVWLVMIVGFGAKAGMMPMQSWLPSAHPVAPAPASAVLSGVITKGGVLAIIRVTYYMFGPAFLADSWAQETLVILALGTVFIGSMLALREQQFKKRLAYSTVSQISYALFGLLLLTPEGFEGAMLQIVFHALAKDTLFLAAGAVILSTNCTRVDQLRGIGRRMPVTMGCFTVAALSLIGIPPMSGFFSKWVLATGALATGNPLFGWGGVAVLILSALLTAGYLLPIVSAGFFPGSDNIPDQREVGPQMTVPMMIFAGLALVLGVFPQWVMHAAQALAKLVF
ncbi:MAG: proton-conducting membrane transporter [Oscillibacter sp.]|jgi:multicomponent Na+:H+ antiporter subunit D|nr:proton-conducting membrane transporter [Oscillibacter sp.]